LILSALGALFTALVYILCNNSGFFGQADDALLLPPLFLAISVTIMVVAQAGGKGDPAMKTILLLAFVVLKFMLPAALAVVWFVVLKNSSVADVLVFFVVYLAFSTAMVLLLTRKLRNNFN
jgi:hypothetical protein